MRTARKVTIARTIAIAGITSAIVLVAGAWLLVQHQRPLGFVRSQAGWNIARWVGKTLVFKIKDDPSCSFKLLELVELAKKDTIFEKGIKTPIRGSDWSLIVDAIVREFHESGNSDRLLRVGDAVLPDHRRKAI